MIFLFLYLVGVVGNTLFPNFRFRFFISSNLETIVIKKYFDNGYD